MFGLEAERMKTTGIRPAEWVGATLRAVVPWYLLFAIGRVTLGSHWSRPEEVSALPHLLWLLVEDTGLMLPFLLFPAGLAMRRILGYSRRAIRVALLVGMSVGILSYVLVAWVAPELEDRVLVARGAETVDARRFGSRTPLGILRNLEFVQANPPPRYSVRASAPQEFPPNVLQWDLHQPLALAVFGLANVLLAMLASELTIDLPRGVRRNARMAIGIGGAVVFMVCVALTSPTEAFLRDGTIRSGIVGAWVPLVIPAIEAVILVRLVTGRRY
jgi:hypothetical protein